MVRRFRSEYLVNSCLVAAWAATCAGGVSLLLGYWDIAPKLTAAALVSFTLTGIFVFLADDIDRWAVERWLAAKKKY